MTFAMPLAVIGDAHQVVIDLIPGSTLPPAEAKLGFDARQLSLGLVDFIFTGHYV